MTLTIDQIETLVADRHVYTNYNDLFTSVVFTTETGSTTIREWDCTGTFVIEKKDREGKIARTFKDEVTEADLS